MGNERGSVLLEAAMAALPLFLLAFFSTRYGLELVKRRSEKYELIQKGEKKLTLGQNDVRLKAPHYSLLLRH